MTARPKALSSADVAASVNVGRRLGRGDLDALTALRWLQGWVSSTPVAGDPQGKGAAGDRDNDQADDEGAAFVLPSWLGGVE